jgi:hypothetical protein
MIIEDEDELLEVGDKAYYSVDSMIDITATCSWYHMTIKNFRKYASILANAIVVRDQTPNDESYVAYMRRT